MSQTIWPLGLNLLNILQYILHNTTSSHIYLFFIKVDHFFLKEQYGSTHIVLDSSLSNDAQKSTYIIYTHIIYIYIYIYITYIYIYIYLLKDQYGSDCILLIRNQNLQKNIGKQNSEIPCDKD